MRSGPTVPSAHVVGVCWIGVKQVAATPVGLGPVAMYSLSLPGTLPFSDESLSWMKLTVPSPGCRGSPAPPQTAASSVVLVGVTSIATHGRLHVKPPFVERLTQTPLVSSVRLKLMSA